MMEPIDFEGLRSWAWRQSKSCSRVISPSRSAILPSRRSPLAVDMAGDSIGEVPGLLDLFAARVAPQQLGAPVLGNEPDVASAGENLESMGPFPHLLDQGFRQSPRVHRAPALAVHPDVPLDLVLLCPPGEPAEDELGVRERHE